jgi:hypothetical protein
MKKIIVFALVTATPFLSFSSRADLRLGPPVNLPGEQSKASALRGHKLMFDSEATNYAIKNSAIFKDDQGSPQKAERRIDYASAFKIDYLWIFNNKSYYSSGLAFVPDAQPLSSCKINPKQSFTDRCYGLLTNAYVCHFFMLNQDLTMAGVERLKIIRSKLFEGKPQCTGIEAIALAKEIPDAFILTVGYKDSAVDLNDYPKAEQEAYKYRTSVLVHLSEQNGKLKLTQDDSCLGNPNKYDTIAKARAALKKCHAQGK